MRVLLFGVFVVVSSLGLSARNISAPTALDIFKHLEQGDKSFLQPASSGRIESAMFGMVRNGGSRFHEGIDIRSVKKMSSGTPMDLIYSVYAGTVAHLSPENNGSYGRYVVLLHHKDGFEFYTLYGHLLSIAPGLKEGAKVNAGTILGMLGQSSTTYKISKASAHLHFEIGMVLGDRGFDSWFLRNYGPGNLHGRYNGFNLVGADPLGFYAFHANKNDFSPVAWLSSHKVAFTLSYPNAAIPSIVKRSPALCEASLSANKCSWEVDFSWFGLPLNFRPSSKAISEAKITLADDSLLSLAEKRGVLVRREGRVFPGKTLINYLEIIFDSSESR